MNKCFPFNIFASTTILSEGHSLADLVQVVWVLKELQNASHMCIIHTPVFLHALKQSIYGCTEWLTWELKDGVARVCVTSVAILQRSAKKVSQDRQTPFEGHFFCLSLCTLCAE